MCLEKHGLHIVRLLNLVLFDRVVVAGVHALVDYAEVGVCLEISEL